VRLVSCSTRDAIAVGNPLKLASPIQMMMRIVKSGASQAPHMFIFQGDEIAATDGDQSV